MKKTDIIQLRIAPKFKEAAKVLAKNKGLSLSSYLVTLISNQIETDSEAQRIFKETRRKK